MHPRWLRCSSLKYSRYSRSSRLAIGAPRPSRCDARLSPRAAKARSLSRFATAAVALEVFLNVGALGGGGALMLGSRGEIIPLPLSALHGSPFDTYFGRVAIPKPHQQSSAGRYRWRTLKE